MAERGVVKVLGKGAVTFAAAYYNEMKVAQGTAKCILMKNFGDLEKYFIHSPVVIDRYLRKIADHNDRVKNVQKHMTFSYPGQPKTEEEKQQFIKDAIETMNRLGYKDQPLVIWEHTDTKNYHIHILSVRVDVNNGRCIDDYQEGRRARRILDQLRGYGHKNEIDKLMEYRFETKEQFKSLLLANGFKAHEDEDGYYTIYRNHDIVGTIPVEDIQKKIDANGRNKDKFKKVIIDLRGKLLDNRRRSLKTKYDGDAIVTDTKSKKGKHTMTNKLSEVKGSRFNGEKGLDIHGQEKAQFKQFLIDLKQKLGISIVFSQWREGEVKGYTLIDNKNKIVFKGSDIIALQKLLNPEWAKGKEHNTIISAEDAASMADEIQAEKNLPQFLEQQLEKLGITVEYDKEKAKTAYANMPETSNRDTAINYLNLVLNMVSNGDDMTEEGEETIRKYATEAVCRAVCADSQRMQEEDEKARQKAEEEARKSEAEKMKQRAEEAKHVTVENVGQYVYDYIDDNNVDFDPYIEPKVNAHLTEKQAVEQAVFYIHSAMSATSERQRAEDASLASYYARYAERLHNGETPDGQEELNQQQNQQEEKPEVIPFVDVKLYHTIDKIGNLYIGANINGKEYGPKPLEDEHQEWWQQQPNKNKADQAILIHYFADEIQKAMIADWEQKHYNAGVMPYGIKVERVFSSADRHGEKFGVNGKFTYKGKPLETEPVYVKEDEFAKIQKEGRKTALSIIGPDIIKQIGLHCPSITELVKNDYEDPAPHNTDKGLVQTNEMFELFTSQLCDDYSKTCGQAAAEYFNAIGGLDYMVAGSVAGGPGGGWRGKKDDDDWWRMGNNIMGLPKKNSRK